MILVDSSVWIDYFRGVDAEHVERLDVLLGTERILMGDLILAEVLQGVIGESDFREARRLLMELECVTIGGQATALQAARNHRFLRSRGLSVRKTLDCLIATRCIMDRTRLLHNDRDFEPFAAFLGLQEA